jgi:hypothetical protein
MCINNSRIMLYGRSRQKFAKLFPDAKFEGYECNIRYCYFTIKLKDKARIMRICEAENIKYSI